MINSLLSFLDASPVNYYAVATLEERLSAAGFRKLDAADRIPQLKAGDTVYFTKNDSSLYAFRIGSKPMADNGVRMICAHCDSPTFRVKPNPEMRGDGGIVRLNTETYGGAILSTWFDRPLSLAGRVLLRTDDPIHPLTRLLRIDRPILTIPNLAIHFNRQVNDGVKLSKQQDMLPILGIVNDQLEKDHTLLNIIARELNVTCDEILDFDLYLYDTTPAQVIGLHGEFVQSGRLDDLSMVHAGLEALLNAKDDTIGSTQVLAIFDNEETGSGTKQGAGSPFLQSLIERLVMMQGGTKEDFFRCVERSFMVSADNAHAWHPNYSSKYDPTNHPVMGGGPVVKFNAAQKYASDADSASVFIEICRLAGVPCQKFVNNSDVAGGSTLGNILTGSLPLRGVDMGNPIWAMHSVRETGNCDDHIFCIKAFTQFYRQ
ncbi:MAG: M18 family aminopeptidase [Bacteroidales bacterium]|nr:M18 family aminopeptidase [Candidatus Liminaster caballi]